MPNIPATLLGLEYNGYSKEAEQAKAAIHRDGPAFLAAVAAELGLQKGAYDLRNDFSGIAGCGTVVLHADHVYLQLGESMFRPGLEILYRDCHDRKDLWGGSNHFVALSSLNADSVMDRFLAQCKKLLEVRSASAAQPKSTARRPAPSK